MPLRDSNIIIIGRYDSEFTGGMEFSACVDFCACVGGVKAVLVYQRIVSDNPSVENLFFLQRSRQQIRTLK